VRDAARELCDVTQLDAAMRFLKAHSHCARIVKKREWEWERERSRIIEEGEVRKGEVSEAEA
jgi:hypothetical protein